MSHLQKQYSRKEEFRDAKLIYIAVEGNVTEYIYFEQLSKTCKNSRTRVVVISRESTKSSPKHILENLISKLTSYDPIISDNVYLVIDRDSWTSKMLSEVEKSCFEKGFSFVVSNPCFELWLLLHLDDISNYNSDTKKLIKENKRISKAKYSKKYLEKVLSDKISGYNKTNIESISKFLPYIKTGIANANKLNPPKLTERGWPNKICTQVHFLAKEIIMFN